MKYLFALLFSLFAFEVQAQVQPFNTFAFPYGNLLCGAGEFNIVECGRIGKPNDVGSTILPSAGTVGDLVVVGPGTQGVQDASAVTVATLPIPLQITTTGTLISLTINHTDLTPSGIDETLRIVTSGRGNNTTFIGVSNAYFNAIDDGSVTSGTKGVLYGAQFSVRPLLSRNNSPFDDADGLVVQNAAPVAATGLATDAIYIGHNSLFTGGLAEWQTGVQVAANSVAAFAAIATFGYGMDLCWGGTCSTISTAAIRIPNASLIVGMNAAGNANITIAEVDASNNIQIGVGNKVVVGGNLAVHGFLQMNGSETAAITSPATSTIHIGFADGPSVFANILGTQGATGSNVSGANWSIVGSLSTGSGISGDIILQTGGTGAGATVQNAAVTALTIKGATQQTIFAGQIAVTAMSQTSAAQSGTVCYNSGTGALNYDATLGCLTSTLEAKNNWQDIRPNEALGIVTRLRPGSFTYKPNMGLPDGQQVGFAAEQVASIDDRLVGYRPDGSLAGVRYQQASALFAGAIQALEARLETLEHR